MAATETVKITRTTAVGAPVDRTIEIPRSLGSVSLLRQIGEGGMGVVWLGRDEMLGRDVAVKFLFGAASGDDSSLAMFIEGARAAAAVRHPGLVGVYTADIVQGVPYLVMEYVEGPTLERVIHRCGSLGLEAGWEVIRSACESVAELHHREIVHRDIKPANVMLTSEPRVVLTDFGLACERRGRDASEALAGTPAYMAPEMYEGVVSPRTDVYALGVMAFEALTGRLPFDGSLEEIRRAHANAPAPIAVLLESGVPEGMTKVIEQALHKSHLFRTKTAHHLLQALEQALPRGFARERCPVVLADLVSRALDGSEGTSEGQGSDPDLPYYDRLSTLAMSRRRSDRLTPVPLGATADEAAPIPGETPTPVASMELAAPERVTRRYLRAAVAASVFFVVWSVTGILARDPIMSQLWSWSQEAGWSSESDPTVIAGRRFTAAPPRALAWVFDVGTLAMIFIPAFAGSALIGYRLGRTPGTSKKGVNKGKSGRGEDPSA